MAAGKKTTTAVGLAEFINTDRERRKNEILAAKVFGKGRRNSAPGAAKPGNKKGGAGLSLASRVGVQKQRSASTANARQQKQNPVGNNDVEWTHDLHSLNNPSAPRVSQSHQRRPRAARSQAHNEKQLLAAINDPASSQPAHSQFNVINKPTRTSNGMSIRGLAGPYIVLAENFAQGTTAADIESAMVPVGGEIRSCVIVSQKPTTAEIVFESKEGAENVIGTFDQQNADGRLLSVYYKPASYSSPPKPALLAAEKLRSESTNRLPPPNGPRAGGSLDRATRYNGVHYPTQERGRESRGSYEQEKVIDGSYGFADKMDLDDGGEGIGSALYSDELVGSRGNGRVRGDGGRISNQARGYR